jgi:hypothetical protein
MLESDHYKQELIALIATRTCQVPDADDPTRVAGGQKGTPFATKRRAFQRFEFRAKAIFEFGPTLPTVPRTRDMVVVITADISRSGAAFLHSEQLYPGEAGVLWLPTGKVPCTIARCVKRGEKCYEIGVRFGGERDDPAVNFPGPA